MLLLVSSLFSFFDSKLTDNFEGLHRHFTEVGFSAPLASYPGLPRTCEGKVYFRECRKDLGTKLAHLFLNSERVSHH